MSIIAFLIVVFFVGLIVGALARLLLPGPDPMSVMETAGIGVLGSLIAGLISLALWGRNGGGIVLSVAVSMLLVYIVRRSRGPAQLRPRRRTL